MDEVDVGALEGAEDRGDRRQRDDVGVEEEKALEGSLEGGELAESARRELARRVEPLADRLQRVLLGRLEVGVAEAAHAIGEQLLPGIVRNDAQRERRGESLDALEQRQRPVDDGVVGQGVDAERGLGGAGGAGVTGAHGVRWTPLAGWPLGIDDSACGVVVPRPRTIR